MISVNRKKVVATGRIRIQQATCKTQVVFLSVEVVPSRDFLDLPSFPLLVLALFISTFIGQLYSILSQ